MGNKKHVSSGASEDRFTKAGFIISAIGSSAGLGNIWKFPYITGQYGGAAFFLLFTVCLLLVGFPILLAELAIGRGSRASAAHSFMKLGAGRTWKAAGLLQVLVPFLILSFYVIVVGWTLHYTVQAFSGRLFQNGDFVAQFSQYTSGYMPLVWQAVAMVLVGLIVVKGVKGGIEKYNKVLIPAMVILLVLLMIRAVTLPGAEEGLSFFLKPDFTQLTPESALVALGHAFFSLSLGMGIMLTYGAYVDQRQSLGTATAAIGAGDLLYALVAGLIIFPTTFSFGISPDEGPSLVFIALPAAFSSMPLGWLFGGFFFLLLAIAALTSSVSIMEVPIAFAKEQWGWSRKKAVWIIASSSFALGVPLSMSLGLRPEFVFGGKTFFDWMDFLTSNILLPLSGILIAIFTGYYWKKAAEAAGLTMLWLRLWLFTLRFIAPVLMVLVLLYTSGVIRF